MLPENLVNTYRRYKDDTNSFVKWLHSKAEACGWKSSDTPAAVSEGIPDGKVQAVPVKPSSTRLKGKARKEAKLVAQSSNSPKQTTPRTVSHIVTTKTLLSQARKVADSEDPVIAVPEVVQYLLVNAIQARKRCSTWFQHVENTEEHSQFHESNEAHQHFIRVLESTFDILEPRFELSSSHESSDSTSNSNDHTRNQNLFDTLNVEDIDEEAFNAMPSVGITASKFQPESQALAVYELELPKDTDLSFIIYCFFEDLVESRNFILQLWDEVRVGKLDFLSASLTANVALQLVRKAEEELIALSPERLGKNSYKAIASMIHPVPEIRLQSPTPPHSAEEMLEMVLETPPRPQSDEFIYLSTFYSLENYRLSVNFRKGLPMVDPLFHQYLRQPELKPENSYYLIEDDLLCQILLDLELRCHFEFSNRIIEKARHAGLLPKLTLEQKEQTYAAFEDQITKGLQSILLEGEINVSAVFEARVLLDILGIFGGKAADAYTNLRKTAATADSALGIQWSRDPKYKKRNGLASTPIQLEEAWINRPSTEHAVKLSFRIKNFVKEDPLVGYKQSVLENHPVTKAAENMWTPAQRRYLDKICSELEHPVELVEPLLAKVLPSEDYTFFYDHHPIYCGIESLRIALDFEKAGFQVANAFSSFASVAHIYNAAKQMHLLEGEWKSLNSAIKNNISKLFHGDLPTTPKHIFSRYFLSFNLPATASARDYRGNRPASQAMLKKAETLLQLPLLSIHLGHYLHGLDSPEKLLINIDLQVNKNDNPARIDRTRLQLLAQLKDCLQESVPKLSIDLVTLTRKCNKLLERIREALKSELGVDYEPEGKYPADLQQYLNFNTVLDIIADAFSQEVIECRDFKRGSRGVQSGKTGDTDQGGRMLVVAARVMQSFLAEANSTISVEPFDVVESTKFHESFLPSAKARKQWEKILKTF
jgi:hypothetical protein